MEPPTPLTPKVQSLTSNVPPIPAPDVTRINLRMPPKPTPEVYDVGGGLSKWWLWVVVATWWITTLAVAFVLGGKVL